MTIRMWEIGTIAPQALAVLSKVAASDLATWHVHPKPFGRELYDLSNAQAAGPLAAAGFAAVADRAQTLPRHADRKEPSLLVQRI